jgi:hypothetical protein
VPLDEDDEETLEARCRGCYPRIRAGIVQWQYTEPAKTAVFFSLVYQFHRFSLAGGVIISVGDIATIQADKHAVGERQLLIDPATARTLLGTGMEPINTHQQDAFPLPLVEELALDLATVAIPDRAS